MSRRAIVMVAMLLLALVAWRAGRYTWLGRHYAQYPVRAQHLDRLRADPAYHVRLLVAAADLQAAIRDGRDGLVVDFSDLDRLLDGTRVRPRKIYGRVDCGPAQFSAAHTRYRYPRFRASAALAGGRGIVPVADLFDPAKNSEGWTNTAWIAVRMSLFLEQRGQDRALGVYETRVTFARTPHGFAVLPGLVAGPLVAGINSDRPDRAILCFATDRPVAPRVVLNTGAAFGGPVATRHRVEIVGLHPLSDYQYQVCLGAFKSPWYALRTPPARGLDVVRFGVVGDFRADFGGGDRDLAGSNRAALDALAAQALAQDCDFLVAAGDLGAGFTVARDDLLGQWQAWQQGVAGFWSTRPVFPLMGNSDLLLRVFRDGDRRAALDRWPYATESSEALFAATFPAPGNGPAPADPRRPPYAGTVYSFHYGPALFIALNNNYWYSSDPARYGGSPAGYLMPDQLAWLEAQLQRAETDPAVRQVFVFAHHPVFPCGAHRGDGMWYDGDNAVRAATWRNGRLDPEPAGVLEARDRLLRAVAGHAKVTAVFTAHEHAYYRLRIDRHVPIGNLAIDDANGDGRIAWPAERAAPLPGLARPTWYLTAGGGGGPYYAEQPTPWADYWRGQPDPTAGFTYSPQESLAVVAADGHRAELKVYNRYGELLDHVRDLAAIRSAP